MLAAFKATLPPLVILGNLWAIRAGARFVKTNFDQLFHHAGRDLEAVARVAEQSVLPAVNVETGAYTVLLTSAMTLPDVKV